MIFGAAAAIVVAAFYYYVAILEEVFSLKLSVFFKTLTGVTKETLDLSTTSVVMPATDKFKDIAIDLLVALALNSQGDGSTLEEYFYTNENDIKRVVLTIDKHDYVCTPNDMSGLAGMPMIGLTVEGDCENVSYHNPKELISITISKRKGSVSACCGESKHADNTHFFG